MSINHNRWDLADETVRDSEVRLRAYDKLDVQNTARYGRDSVDRHTGGFAPILSPARYAARASIGLLSALPWDAWSRS